VNKNLTGLLKYAGINKIGLARPIFKPLHFYLKKTGFPNTKKAYESILSVPIYPTLSIKSANIIIKTLNKFK